MRIEASDLNIPSRVQQLFYNGWRLSYFRPEDQTDGYWRMERPGFCSIGAPTLFEVIHRAILAEETKRAKDFENLEN